jgi:DNA (cytosine-5)-methyltransferase 1
MMKHGSLFSGIGGFDLASEWMGWENVFHCEWNEFGKKVLHHYWPNAESFDDITKTDFTKYANKIDILTGGFPCQPYSQAGQRKGKEDERHLWPQMLRAIREIKPKYIVGENVFGLLNWNGGMVFDEVHSDLELEGYEVQAVVIPAAAVNAPHGRDRVWFVATNTQFKSQGSDGGTNDETEGNIRRGNEGNVFGTLRGDGVIADTNGISNWGKSKQSPATHKQGRSGKTNTGIGNEGEQQFVRDITGEGLDSNTDSVRLQHTEETRNIQESTRTTQSEGGEFTKPVETNGSDGNVTNTMCEGLQGRQEVDGRRKYDTKGSSVGDEFRTNGTSDDGYPRNGWQKFPTESPICGGDDGLPTELDGITFSKWRNESIKAYGNAIVPQVAYQIFKAIQETI